MEHQANTPNPTPPKRRVFMKQCGIAFLGGLASASFVPIVSATEHLPPDFIETTLTVPDEAARGSRILVAYASMYGSTSGIALSIGQELARLGHAVDVRSVAHANDLSAYSAAVIGSAIKGSKWMDEGVAFLKHNEDLLSTIPVAYFHASMTMSVPDNQELKTRSESWFEPLEKEFPAIVPVAKGSFAGALDFSKMSFMHRTMYPIIAGNSREGDFRNFPKIREWTKEAHPGLAARSKAA